MSPDWQTTEANAAKQQKKSARRCLFNDSSALLSDHGQTDVNASSPAQLDCPSASSINGTEEVSRNFYVMNIRSIFNNSRLITLNASANNPLL